jgi:hypothetical protein
VSTCFPTIQIGGFDKQSSWAYFNITTNNNPPPDAFVLPAICDKATEIGIEEARILLSGHPLAMQYRPHWRK